MRYAHKGDKNDIFDWAARILAVVCLLNLNGVFSMMFDRGQVMSLLMLSTALVLVFRTGRYAWSPPFILLMVTIGSYLVFGILFYSPMRSVEPSSKYLQTYFNTILIVWAMTGYVASLEGGVRLTSFLYFIRNILLLSAASVWVSPILYEHYVNVPPSAEQRMGGFFGNPNEAAVVSMFAVAFSLALPFSNRFLQLGALAMAGIAICLTFSKTGMSSLVVVLTWHMLRTAKGFSLALLPVAALLLVAFIQDPQVVMQNIADSHMLELDASQKARILAVGQILSGEINNQTTTGRTYLWGVVIERAMENFPWGSGLGSGHHVVDGVMELGVWQGAHNTFLMIWLEAGVLPFLLFIAALVLSILASVRYARGYLELTCMFIILVSMTSGHTALGARYQNIMLAIVLGLIAGCARRIRNRRIVATADRFNFQQPRANGMLHRGHR